MPPAAPSDAPLSYGAVQDPANSSTPTPTSLVRPGLPARTLSLRSARSLSAASGLTPSTTLRQSGSLRALFRLTSTGSNADAITPTPQPKQTPASLQHARSLRTHRRVAKEAVPLLRRSLTTSQLPPLLRAMSSVLRLPRDEEIRFQCHICFDDAVPISDAVTLAACGHRYCTACFQSYVELKIRDGHVYPVCFHPLNDAGQPDRKTCGVAVATDQIERIVTPEVWKKLKLFRFNKEHEHARECPHCAFAQECRGPAHPACLCDHCHGAFCFFHDLAHDGRSCADYELENAETESINRAAINQIAKSCPGCHRDVEKDGGCNHMKCVVCQTSFCWLCSEVIEDVPMPSHFSESNENSCSGRQFDGSEPMELPWQVRAYAIGITILCYPFAFLSAVVATPVTWCRSTLSSKAEAVEEKNTVSEMFWFNHTVAMIWLALGFSLIFFIVAIALELTFRLLVFVVVLPLLIVKAIVVKSINCCRRQRQSTPTLTPPNIYGEMDLEAGHVNGVVSPPPAKPEGENAVARPPAAMA